MGVRVEVRETVGLNDLRLTQFDQILVCGPWVEATDVQVGFAQLLSPTAAVADGGGGGVATAVVAGARRSHLMVGRGQIRLLQTNGPIVRFRTEQSGTKHIVLELNNWLANSLSTIKETGKLYGN